MPLFILAFGIAQALFNLLAIVQFLWLLFAAAPNRFPLRFGRLLSVWLADAACFLSSVTDDKPSPWKACPMPGDAGRSLHSMPSRLKHELAPLGGRSAFGCGASLTAFSRPMRAPFNSSTTSSLEISIKAPMLVVFCNRRYFIWTHSALEALCIGDLMGPS
jgi:hypothetical protein